MAKLTAKYEYRKDGSKNIKGYLLSLPKLELEKNGFNANSEISFEIKEDKIIIKKEENKMTKKEILENIEGNGGFDNFNRWNTKEIAEWVESNFDCTKYVAKQVACELQ